MANEDIQAKILLVFGIIIISAMAGATGSIIIREMAETMIFSFILAIVFIGLIGTLLFVIGIIKLFERYS
jgi:hypothetical protein